MRDSGWDQLPPDVRFAGEAPAENESPPWIAIYLNHPLTEKPSCEAEHMAAPTKPAGVKKVLANSEPSTHGTSRTSRDVRLESAKWSQADIGSGSLSRSNSGAERARPTRPVVSGYLSRGPSIERPHRTAAKISGRSSGVSR